MSQKLSPQRVLKAVDKVISAWKANDDYAMGKEVTLAGLEKDRKDLDGLIKDVSAKETELTGLTNDRNDLTAKCNKCVTRVRSGFRAVYGPDSKQYEQVGGTRTANRKKPGRRSQKSPASIERAA